MYGDIEQNFQFAKDIIDYEDRIQKEPEIEDLQEAGSMELIRKSKRPS